MDGRERFQSGLAPAFSILTEMTLTSRVGDGVDVPGSGVALEVPVGVTVRVPSGTTTTVSVGVAETVPVVVVTGVMVPPAASLDRPVSGPRPRLVEDR
jgi:hypothetical protein